MKWQLGRRERLRHKVLERDLATNWENDVPVLATPVLMWLAEKACVEVINSQAAEPLMTVGYAHDMTHLAATPVGWTIELQAELVAADGRFLSFSVSGNDGADEIVKGTHVRVLVDRSRFIEKLTAKTNS